MGRLLRSLVLLGTLTLPETRESIHTVQRMSGCEVSPELRFTRGFYQFAYNGSDYISLATETYTWIAAVPRVVNTKHKWEAERGYTEGKKAYLEECVMWVKHLDTLQKAG